MSGKKSLNLITLGCSKNLVDSEHILGQLENGKYQLLHNASGPADIVIINTCGFIRDAKEESIETILEYVEAKKQGFVSEILVIGCLSQRYKEILKKEIPEVDAWFGAREFSDLITYLTQQDLQQGYKRYLTTPPHYAYLKIAEGCDRRCSFCAIPFIRGPFRSRPIQCLVAEAQALAGQGVKELLLVAQDLSYYGYDLVRKPLLAPLLKELSSINGIEWIRLHYAYPQDFPEEVISIIAKNPKICRYLDIPLQHINNKILKAMRRGNNKQSTLKLIENLRRQIPGVALRTTLMVGFPGETRREFEELLSFAQLVRFERLGVFTYSPEEDTASYLLLDTVKEIEKQRRADQLMELQAGISLELNQQKIGETFKVLIDRVEGNYFIGRTEFDSPEVDNEVLVKKSEDICIGDFVNVRIHSATEFELLGTPVFQKPNIIGYDQVQYQP